MLKYMKYSKMKWQILQHNGILFPPPYESHGMIIKINGEEVKPNLLQEEMIYQWCKKKDTKYVSDKTFQKNLNNIKHFL